MSVIDNLPNPFTPLAFLDPQLAAQFEASRYVPSCSNHWSQYFGFLLLTMMANMTTSHVGFHMRLAGLDSARDTTASPLPLAPYSHLFRRPVRGVPTVDAIVT
jgi:hypothetical protein